MLESAKDELVMKLIHYFMTKENYAPVQVRGVDNEIWLENMSGNYKIIRIISRYVHNNEQLDLDIYRAKQVAKKIKRKTFSMGMNILNIYTDLGDNVTIHDDKGVKNIKLNSENDIKNLDTLNDTFKDIRKNLKFTEEGVALFVKITNDINKKNLVDNKHFDETFKKKTPYITYGLIIINVLIYLLVALSNNYNSIMNTFCLHGPSIRNGEFYRLITSMFLHVDIIHLGFNMYSLYLIGSLLECYVGKYKYTFIYFLSGIIGNLLTIVLSNNASVGASGAIFGIMGGLLYFGYHYRLLLEGFLKGQLIPVIIINLLYGFMVAGINNVAHIGGLIGGILATSMVGIKYKSTKTEQINGFIITSIFIIFLLYMGLFIKV